jgi:hypothetical protein
MIDPYNITKYNRTDDELEEVLLWWTLVTGKDAFASARALGRFMAAKGDRSPFEYVRYILSIPTARDLASDLKAAGIGCYTIRARTWTEVVNSNLDLRTCTVDDLEKIFGIGRKTSRAFILHSRENAQVAVIDRHMMTYLAKHGHVFNQKSLKQIRSTQYLRAEQKVLKLAKKKKMTPAEFDLHVWRQYARERRAPKVPESLRLRKERGCRWKEKERAAKEQAHDN